MKLSKRVKGTIFVYALVFFVYIFCVVCIALGIDFFVVAVLFSAGMVFGVMIVTIIEKWLPGEEEG